MSVVPVMQELTTQRAANVLGMSRPFLIDLLNHGEIPFHKVGTHRRIYRKDVMDYLAACVKSPVRPGSQAKAPAPRLRINNLRHKVGRASACQDFCRGLLAKRDGNRKRILAEIAKRAVAEGDYDQM